MQTTKCQWEMDGVTGVRLFDGTPLGKVRESGAVDTPDGIVERDELGRWVIVPWPWLTHHDPVAFHLDRNAGSFEYRARDGSEILRLKLPSLEIAFERAIDAGVHPPAAWLNAVRAYRNSGVSSSLHLHERVEGPEDLAVFRKSRTSSQAGVEMRKRLKI